MKTITVVALASLVLSAANTYAGPVYSIEDKIPQAIESYYSPRICNVLKNWPPREVPALADGANPLWMRGIKTPGNEGYIGVEKRMMINAPLARVSSLLDDFTRYKDRTPDLKEVRVVAREGNRVTTAWETKSPVFFVPNTRYELVWTVDTTSPQRTVYRFQLKSSNHLKSSDTLIVLEARGETTQLTTFDFFQLDLGFVGAFATTKKIWKKTFEGYYSGDIALKAQAEHPDWTAKQLKKEAEQMLDKFPVEPLQFSNNTAVLTDEPTKVSAR